VSHAVLDDHLLRDLLADDIPSALAKVLDRYQPATTNLYLSRLCKSVVSARGGALTRAWTTEQRNALGSQLLSLPVEVEVVPMQTLAFRMAEISTGHRVSTLGAECLAASEHLDAPVYVWSGDDGPGIRAAMKALRRPYRTIRR
jgi:hypothetical protein